MYYPGNFEDDKYIWSLPAIIEASKQRESSAAQAETSCTSGTVDDGGEYNDGISDEDTSIRPVSTYKRCETQNENFFIVVSQNEKRSHCN